MTLVVCLVLTDSQARDVTGWMDGWPGTVRSDESKINTRTDKAWRKLIRPFGDCWRRGGQWTTELRLDGTYVGSLLKMINMSQWCLLHLSCISFYGWYHRFSHSVNNPAGSFTPISTTDEERTNTPASARCTVTINILSVQDKNKQKQCASKKRWSPSAKVPHQSS